MTLSFLSCLECSQDKTELFPISPQILMPRLNPGCLNGSLNSDLGMNRKDSEPITALFNLTIQSF